MPVLYATYLVASDADILGATKNVYVLLVRTLN